MSKLFYGYRMRGTEITVDEIIAVKIRKLFELYSTDMSMQKASDIAGIDLCINQVKHLLENRVYLGNELYPAIVAPELFEAAQAVRQKRTQRLGKYKLKHRDTCFPIYTTFSLEEQTEHFEDARLQAQYIYSLIRRA